MMQKREQTLTLTGEGKTKRDALSMALSGIQKKITQDEPDITVIRIEPLDVTFQKGCEVHTTERFLFFFGKRTVLSYELTVEVRVMLTYIEHEAFPFEIKNVNRFV